jgi:hypothetical protein
MTNKILQDLTAQQCISAEQAAVIREHEHKASWSLHWELKTILYLGVLLLNTGLGLLIYLNIDTIGHQVVIALIAAVCVASFWYASTHKAPFSYQKVESPSPYFDYMVLLGCFTFLILEGYLQYQYQFFGEKYGLATFIPMVLFFFVAYYFDHMGVLAMAITALGSWLGIAVTPMEIFQNNDFASARLIYTGIVLGTALCGIAFLTEMKNIKKHFTFTYLNFGAHLLFIACLSGLMVLEQEFLFTGLLLVLTLLAIWYAKQERSFYFLIIGVVYAYWGISYLIFQIDTMRSELVFYYFIFSCGGIIFFLARYKKILNIQDK